MQFTYHSSLIISSFPLHRYFLVSATTTPLSRSSAIRFGSAIRALAASAKFHTTSSVATEPIITNMTHAQRYGLIALLPNRYSIAFSP